MSDQSTFAERIIEAREAKNLTVEQVAERASVTIKTLRQWEAGSTKPRSNKLQMLSGVLGVTLTWLIDGSVDHDPELARPSGLDQLELKMQRMALLQCELQQLSHEIAEDLAAMKKIDDELESLVA